MWSNDSNEYAIRESATKVKLYKNFQVCVHTCANVLKSEKCTHCANVFVTVK